MHFKLTYYFLYRSSMSNLEKLIIVGLGNPFLTDDSVGIKVARILKEELVDETNIDVTEVYAGGLRLMDELIGYDKAIIIDAMVTRKYQPGTIIELSLKDMIDTKNLDCMHDMNLPMALELGQIGGLKLPEQIDIIGIEAVTVDCFNEEVSPELRGSVWEVVALVKRKLGCLEKAGVN